MKIVGFIENTMIDWPGKISCEIFTAGCNFSCPTCHAGKIVREEGVEIEEDYILQFVKERKGWIDGIVICGGEPTIQNDLQNFMKRCKEEGIKIKLDTNGSKPEVLEKLIEKGLVDYVAMDVKGPKELYSVLIGKSDKNNFKTEKIEESMKILGSSPIEYEFRTTIVPIYENRKIRWLDEKDVKKEAEWILRITGKKHNMYVQTFHARNREEMVGEKMSKENLPKEFHKTPESLLEKICNVFVRYGFECKKR